MNKNLSNNPTKLCTRGGKRFRCYKNYATRQQELVAITLPGCTREARIQACDKCNPTTRTRASQLVGKFTLSNKFIIRVRYYPTSNFQLPSSRRPKDHSSTPNYDKLPEGCKKLMSFGHPMHIFKRNFCYANGTCIHLLCLIECI